MKSTIDAMKQAIEAFELSRPSRAQHISDNGYIMAGNRRADAMCELREAIKREEAQAVEPTKATPEDREILKESLDVCTDGGNCKRCKLHKNHRREIPHAGIPVGDSYGATSSAPVIKQSLSTERSALLERMPQLNYNNHSLEEVADLITWASEAADMLAADAHSARTIEVLRAERDHARACRDNGVKILSGIHSMLCPKPFATPDGRTMVFRPKNPDPHEVLQELSDRIRAIPDEMLAADAPFQPDWVNYRQGVADGKAEAQTVEPFAYLVETNVGGHDTFEVGLESSTGAFPVLTHPASPSSNPVDNDCLTTERFRRVTSLALHRFISAAHQSANEAGQDKTGIRGGKAAVDAFLRDANDAEELRAMLASSPQPTEGGKS